MIWIGIDPGTNTGFAVWDGDAKCFIEVSTLAIHEALQRVAFAVDKFGHKGNGVAVVFEDARQRTWFGNNTAAKDRAKLQGAGSVKRDCSIWEDALTDWGVRYHKTAPKNGITKMNPEYFKRLTGYTKRTSEHGRDAAMLVFGR